MAKSFSDAITIPIVGYEHPPDVPSASVLSRLNVFDRWRNVPDTYTEQKQRLHWSFQEARRQEGKEAQQKDKRNATGDTFPAANGGGGSGDSTPRGQTEQDGHCREDPETWTGNEALVSGDSGGSNGGYDGGGRADGSGSDGGW